MQGNLTEIDLPTLLQLLELGQRTGELYIEAATGQSWFVFLQDGKITYATDALGLGTPSLERLADYWATGATGSGVDDLDLYRQSPSTSAASPEWSGNPEYGQLWSLLQQERLSSTQAVELLKTLICETLFELLTLRQGYFQFMVAPPLAPMLASWVTTTLVLELLPQVRRWSQLLPRFGSPAHCLQLTDRGQEALSKVLRQLPPDSLLQPLCHYLLAIQAQPISLRRLSRCQGVDFLTLAQTLLPAVEQGWLAPRLIYPQTQANKAKLTASLPKLDRQVPRILCIDDALTVCQSVEGTLSKEGYEVTTITHPLKALGLVFTLNPDLIFCDITMPELDGYQICAMLRQSSRFRYTPIVMLTSLDGLVERARARMAGATAYLSKPFTEGELTTLVEAQVGPGTPERLTPEQLLQQALEDLKFTS